MSDILVRICAVVSTTVIQSYLDSLLPARKEQICKQRKTLSDFFFCSSLFEDLILTSVSILSMALPNMGILCVYI